MVLSVFTFCKGTVFSEIHPNLYALFYAVISQVLGVWFSRASESVCRRRVCFPVSLLALFVGFHFLYDRNIHLGNRESQHCFDFCLPED